MSGIQGFSDRQFLQPFKAIGGVILRSQKPFLVGWPGSVVILKITLLLSFWKVLGFDLVLCILPAASHFLGVRVPTA